MSQQQGATGPTTLGSSTGAAGLAATLGPCPVVGILRAPTADRFVAATRVLLDAGIRAVELTFTTAGVLDAIAELAAAGLPGLVLGAGTVTTPDQARAAVGAGATYLVAPNFSLPVVEEAHRLGVPVVPGALSPTEITTAAAAGVAMVKVFPIAPVGGPAYIRALRGPLPDIPLLPTGGVRPDLATEYLAAGATAIGVSGPLLGDACLPGGDLPALGERARALAAAATAWAARAAG